MDNSKLISVLKSLDKAELRAFKRFLSSKIFNQQEVVIQLFDYLRAELKSPKPKLDKKTVFKKLFPKEPFKEKTIRDIMSYLSVPLDQFLAFQKFYEHPGDELLALCKAFRERNLLKQFESAVNKTLSLQQKSGLRDSEYHHRNYRLEQEKYHASTQKGRAHTTNLAEVTRSLDISYFTNRLRQSCFMLSHQSVFNVSYNFRIVEEIIDEVNRQDLLHIPAISIYYYCYLALTNPDNFEYFKALRNNLTNNASLFTIAEMKDIYLLAINIAIKKQNQGKTEVIPDLLELYRSGVSQKILLTNNILSRFTYTNVVSLGLLVKEFDWIEKFISEYKLLLEEEYREITYQFNLAKFHYSKKEYSDAVELLFLLVSSDDIYINLGTKILLSRIYYEQNELDALSNLIDSFKKTLIRKKEILGYHQTSYKNFVNCLNKLSLLNPYDRSAKKALLEEIQSTQPLPDKYWFEEQLS